MTHSQKSLVLRALESGPKTIWQLTEDLRISRPGARIFELKRKGHVITDEWKEVQGRRVKVYTLEGHSQQMPASEGQSDFEPLQRYLRETTQACANPACRVTLKGKRKTRRYCSAKCRWAYWNRQHARTGFLFEQEARA